MKVELVIEGFVHEVIREEDCKYYKIRRKKGYDFLNIQEKDFEFSGSNLGILIRDIKERVKLRKANVKQLKILDDGIYVKSGSFKLGDKVYITSRGVKKK